MSALPVLLPKRMYQVCPLCKEDQPMFIKGHVPDIEKPSELRVVYDRGYSFCNCHNIWFTNWKNMDQSVYDEEYKLKYRSEGINNLYKKYCEKYYPIISTFKSVKTFAEVGCINPTMLDKARELGWVTTGIDIDPTVDSNGHELFICDIEKYSSDRKFDVIWMSHVFEHLKDVRAISNGLNNLLNEDGLLFVAMPDPFMIDINNPYTWGHWHIKEHHIMWDMDSFINFMAGYGFECLYKYRNTGGGFISFGDFHIIFKKIY